MIADQHDELQRLNEARLQPLFEQYLDWREMLIHEMRRRVIEHTYLAQAREEVAAAARDVPSSVEGFLAWFERLRDVGPGQQDPLLRWLEHVATLDELRWFLRQELAGEAGFEDLVVVTQLRMPTRVRLELARSYWDELERGNELGGPTLHRLGHVLELDQTIAPVPEAIALGNLLAGLAFNRAYAYHSIGALGAMELIAPGRSRFVKLALERLGVVRQHYSRASTLDVRHSDTWNREVIGPLVDEVPTVRFAIAEGALMRLHAGQRCFERYRRELGVGVQ